MMKFSDIAGHEDVKEALRRAADEGKLPHALLLGGKPGIGKMMLARALAQYIHCSHREGGDSCGRCPSCLQHRSFNNPDVHFVYPVVKIPNKKETFSTDFIDQWKQMLEENPFMPFEQWSEMIQNSKTGNKRPQIYREEADALNASASLSTFKEDCKIYIIWLPELMNTATANKLLKLLEEPYEDTQFILVSNSPGNVLPTIFSRTQPYLMKALSDEEISRCLETDRGLDRQTAYETARLAEGSLGRAFELADGAEESAEFAGHFRDMMRMAYARKIGGLRKLGDTLALFNRPKLLRFLDYCGRMTRENFIYNLQLPQLNLMRQEEKEFAHRFAPFIHSGNVERIAEEFGRASRDIGGNANAKIVMFSLGLLLCQLIRTAKPT